MGKKILFILILIFSFSYFSFAQNASDEISIYEENKSAQIIKDLRRFEIITLGSLPFVTMDISLIYSTLNPKLTPNPFLSITYDPATDESFWKTDCGKVIMFSVITSFSVGITDYVLNAIKRNNIKKIRNSNKKIIITDLENDPDATKLNLPEKKEKN